MVKNYPNLDFFSCTRIMPLGQLNLAKSKVFYFKALTLLKKLSSCYSVLLELLLKIWYEN